MQQDRRDSGRRADSARRVLERIVSDPARAVSCDELARSTDISASAAMRIVRQLAIRMLVRNVAPGHWIPTPVLSRCPVLQPGS
jgi:DNA-binding IclR family transcriptional regulator